MTKNSITRQQLHSLLWEKPITHIANDLEIPACLITSICTKHDIPRPPTGYWTKIRFNKHPAITPLPDPVIDQSIGFTTSIAKDEKIYSKTIGLKQSLRGLHPLVQHTYDRLNYKVEYPNIRRRSRGDGLLDVSVRPKHLKRAI